MIYKIPKPELSPDFTIDDIHKIREWNYERLKDATYEERLQDSRSRTEPILRQIEAIRKAKYS
jgi:hypothetical protein